jgi:cysteine synthase
MVARVAAFEGIDVEAAEQTMESAMERIQPMLDSMQGWQGRLDLLDRSSGKFISINFFDSDANLEAAEPTFDEEMPKQLGEIFEKWSGRRTSVERYEVVGEVRR